MATNGTPIATTVDDAHTQAFRGALKQSSKGLLTMATIAAAVSSEHGYKPMIAWLKEEFDASPRFGDRLLQIHKNLLSVANLATDSLELIAPSALYLLASPSTPDEVRQEVVEQAKAGKKITHAAAKDAVKVAVKRKEPEAAPITPNPAEVEEIADDDIWPDEPPVIETKPAPAPVIAPDPWQAYNAAIDGITKHISEAREAALSLDKLDQHSPAFAQWIDPKHWRQFFNDVITTFESRKVVGFATAKQKTLLPDGQPFLYEIDTKRLNTRKRGA